MDEGYAVWGASRPQAAPSCPTNSDPSGCGAAACVAEDRDAVAEGRECTTIGRHGVVVEEAAHDLPQPLPLLGDRLVHAPSQFLLHLPQLRRHAVTPGLPLELKVAPAVLAADEGEAQEVEGLRPAQPARLAPRRRVAAELDQAGLLRMQRQRELLKPCAHHVEEPTSVSLVLEPGHKVSRPAESHRQALAEPDVRLPPHPAPIVRPYPRSSLQ